MATAPAAPAVAASPKRMTMDYRLLFNDKLRGFRDWVESRDSRRFAWVVFGVLFVALTAVIASAHLTDSGSQTVKVWGATAIFVLLELMVLFSFLAKLGRKALEDNNLLLVIATLFLGFAVLARLLLLPMFSPYLIPMAALGMLATVILNVRTGLLLVTLESLNVGLMTDYYLGFTLVALLVGVFALHRVSHLGQRAEFLSASFLVMLTGGAAIFAAELLREASVASALESSLWAGANGLLTLVLTVSLLIMLETVFNLTTPLRLLELANPAHPLLRRLMQLAPGTYNHSIMMGSLAEAAAEAVGANALLARVGAYYHDIGKAMRPEYFIENQLHIENPHDRLNPNLSKLAITAHVREGEELGREYGLPKPIIDIIKQHHGTSVLSYFYHKAREQAHGEDVTEEEYRYEAEKPQSPEAAIIMMADSVEAAARAMKNPTPKKLQGLIGEIIKQKMDDGQLDQSQLTLGDLHRIREIFETQLWGLLGHRIAYPGESAGQVRAERRAAKVAAAAGGRDLAGAGPGGSRPGKHKLQAVEERAGRAEGGGKRPPAAASAPANGDGSSAPPPDLTGGDGGSAPSERPVHDHHGTDRS